MEAYFCCVLLVYIHSGFYLFIYVVFSPSEDRHSKRTSIHMYLHPHTQPEQTSFSFPSHKWKTCSFKCLFILTKLLVRCPLLCLWACTSLSYILPIILMSSRPSQVTSPIFFSTGICAPNNLYISFLLNFSVYYLSSTQKNSISTPCSCPQLWLLIYLNQCVCIIGTDTQADTVMGKQSDIDCDR